MTGTKSSVRGSSRAGSRQNIGSNRAGRNRDPSKRGSPGKPKYEKKRSAEDLLAQKMSSLKSGGNGDKTSNGMPRANGGSGGGQRGTSCMNQCRRKFSCLAEEVTYELDLEASNACKLLGCKFLIRNCSIGMFCQLTNFSNIHPPLNQSSTQT